MFAAMAATPEIGCGPPMPVDTTGCSGCIGGHGLGLESMKPELA